MRPRVFGPGDWAVFLYLIRWPAVAIALLLVWLWGRRPRASLAVAATATLLLVALCFVLGRPPGA